MKFDHKSIAVLALLIIIPGMFSCTDDSGIGISGNLPFEMPEIPEPIFPDRRVNVVDFGAVGDGHTLNTDAFSAAILSCAEAGGGRIHVPPGIWLTGPIRLQSHIDLHLERGATLQFTDRFEDYPLIRGTWEGQAEVRRVSPIYGKDLVNVGITGQGIIDGAGDAWRPVKKFKLTDRAWNQLIKSGGVVSPDGKIWWPSPGAMTGRELVNQLNNRGDAKVEEYASAREYLRPVMINLVNCKNVLLEGPTFQNSPAWNIHPLLCENVIVRNITVRNPWYAQNGDGIDLESCRNVLVHNCQFDVGDDAICIKSGKNEYGRLRGVPTENVVISNCVVYHGHGGFTVGSEMSGGVRNIYVHNCTFLDTDVGLRFKSTRGRGGVVENIYIKDIFMENIVMEAIRFNLFYAHKEPVPEVGSDGLAIFSEVAPELVSEETPQFRNIHMENIVCRGARQAVLLYGLPEMAIKNVDMKNIRITADLGVICVDADQITFQNMKITPVKEPTLLLLNTRNVLIDGVTVPNGTVNFLTADGSKTENIRIKNHGGSVNQSMLNLGKQLSSAVVEID